jgi:archaellum component FlaC
MAAHDHAQADVSRHGNVYDATMSAVNAATTDARLDALGEKIDDLGDRIDQRFEQVDKRFEQVDKRFEQIERRMESLEERFFRLGLATFGSQAVIAAGLIGLIATQI